MELVIEIFLWWLAFETAWFLVKWYLSYREITRIDQEVTEIFKDLRENCKVVYVETVGNVHLMYDHITGNFVCQGNNDAELWQRAKQMFPNKEFIIKDMLNGAPTFDYKRVQ